LHASGLDVTFARSRIQDAPEMIAPNPHRLSEPTLFDSARTTFGVLHRHRRRAIGFCVAVLVLVAGWLVLAPRQYQSEARLFVKVGRQSVALDPTATTGQTLPVYESREVEINSVLDLLSSRVILERVVDELGARTILTGRELPPHLGPDDPAAYRLQREQAIRRLEETIAFSHGRKSSVIDVTARAASPRLAQRILQSFLTAFDESYLEANRTSGSHEFFVQQAELLSSELQQATHELSAAKNEINLISIEEQRRTIQSQMSDVESQRIAAQTALATSEATFAQLREMLDRLPERLVTQTVAGFPDGADGQTRRQLYALEIREQELLTKYTAHHPLVKAVREQIVAAREILAQPGTPVEQTTLAINPARQQLELQLLNEQTHAVAHRARVAALATQQAAIAARLRDLNDREGRIARLEARVNLLKASHQSYAERREQARIDQALADSRITNVNVVQPPTYVSRPVAPSKRLVAGLGLFVALAGAVGLAFVCEYLRRGLLSPTSGVSMASATPHAHEHGTQRNGNGRIPHSTETHSHDVREVPELVDRGVCG
jgi:polysaccharide biosynthesis protein PslE